MTMWNQKLQDNFSYMWTRIEQDDVCNTNSIELPACAIVQQRKAWNNQHKIRVATNNFNLEF